RRIEALEQLHRNFYADIRLFFTRVLLDDRKSQILTEEVFLRVWREADSFRADERVLVWLLELACSIAPSSAELKRVEARTQGLSSPAGSSCIAELRGNLAREYARLDIKERILLTLTYQLGCSPDEIARITRSHVANLKGQLFTALEGFRGVV